MAMSKEERNRRRRERYKAFKEAGLTREQARAPRKYASQENAVWRVLKKLGDTIVNKVSEPLPDSFELFASYQLDENPKKSATAIIKEYRRRGGKISDAKARDAVGDLKDYITTYTNRNNPDKKRYFKDKYIYKIRYEVSRNANDGKGKPTNDVRYGTISSPRRLNKGQAYDELIEMIKEIEEDGDERYQVEAVVPGSAVILYRVNTDR